MPENVCSGVYGKAVDVLAGASGMDARFATFFNKAC